MTINKNSNLYQIVYSAVMVVIVGALLAGVYMMLKPKQDENRANDKRKQILSAIHVKGLSDNEVGATYEKYIIDGFLVDEAGNKVADKGIDDAFAVDMKKNLKNAKGGAKRDLPVFVAKLDDGSTKYIVPVYGAGLWGPIWGYVAMDADGVNVYGAYFSHEGETPGLGAEIEKDNFQDQFQGKKIYVDGEFKSIGVMKAGQKPTNGAEYVNAISGGTITSRGVQAMLEDCLKPYDAFFKSLKGGVKAECGKDADCKAADCKGGECKCADCKEDCKAGECKCDECKCAECKKGEGCGQVAKCGDKPCVKDCVTSKSGEE